MIEKSNFYTKHVPSCTCSLCAAVRAETVSRNEWANHAPIPQTLNYSPPDASPFWSSLKVASPAGIEPKWPRLNNNTHPWTSAYSSLTTTNFQNPQKQDTANGPLKTSIDSPSVKKSPSLGLPTDNAKRKELQMWTYLLEYFPDAFLAEVGVAIAGNKQHHEGKPLHWDRAKSTDQLNTAFRHMWDHARGITKDTDGHYHLAKARWRLGAELQLTIERERDSK